MNLPFVQNIQGIKGTNGLIKCNNFQLLTIAFLVENAYLSRAILNIVFFPFLLCVGNPFVLSKILRRRF